jgi:hypothetical protein
MQGTEMWLAVLWLLVDYLSESEALGYRPRRPQSVPGSLVAMWNHRRRAVTVL